MQSLHEEQEKLSEELRESSLYKELQKQKKRVETIDRKAWQRARDSVDDYACYTQLVHETRNLPLPKKELGFLNRCTMKLNEIDILSNRALSHAHHYTASAGQSFASRGLRFLDLCGGPGGFPELLLLIHKWESVGLGVTRKAGSLDYQCHRFHSNAPRDTFISLTELFPELSGDLFDAKVVSKLLETVRDRLGQVDLVMADGAEDHDEDQERLSLPLQIQQCAAASQCLAANGTLLLKCFDVSQSETIRLLSLLQSVFHRLTCVKPSLSRSSNSERYIICQGFLPKGSRLSFESWFQYVQEGKIPEEGWFQDLPYAEFSKHLREHLLHTWEVQIASLQSLFLLCAQRNRRKRKHETPDDLQWLATYWKRWRLCFYIQGLDRKPLVAEVESSDQELCLPIYHDWNYLYDNDLFLKDLSLHYEINELDSVSLSMEGKWKPQNVSSPYPCGTVVLLERPTHAVKKVLALPKYPAFVLEPSTDWKDRQWKKLTHNVKWWEKPVTF